MQQTVTKSFKPYWAIALAMLIVGIAYLLGEISTIASSSVIALLLGMLIAQGLSAWRLQGLEAIYNLSLKLAIVGLGFNFNIFDLLSNGQRVAYLCIAIVCLGFALSTILARLFKLPNGLALLLGAGSSICGGSAIAAIAPLLRVQRQQISLALSLIFLFNLLLLLLLPLIGRYLALDDRFFGIWAGLAIHDTSGVLAAAEQYSQAALETATLVKLTRVCLIVPVGIIIHWIYRRSNTPSLSCSLVPWYVLAFIAASCLHSFVSLPSLAMGAIQAASHFFLLLALAAIGLLCPIATLLATGIKPILFAAILCVLLAVSSYLMVMLAL